MELLPKDYLLLAGVLLTFLATILGHFNTRRNIKTSKYIEVVTTERIKWLSIIRNEVSEIVSLITNTLIFYENEMNNIESENPTQDMMNDANYEHQRHYFDAMTTNAFQPSEFPKLKELTSKLTLLQLRFNPDEDLKTLELINFFTVFYQSKYITTKDLQIASEKTNLLIKEIQAMLKREWEKVKKESKGG